MTGQERQRPWMRPHVAVGGQRYALYSVPDFGECRWTLLTDNIFGWAAP